MNENSTQAYSWFISPIYRCSYVDYEQALKNERLLGENYPCREDMICEVEDYIKYYNQERLHTANNDCSLIDFEMSQVYVSGFF